MKRISVRHEFVHFIPEVLEERTIYVSIPFATVVHKCCCGCGHEVVTPLGPTDWGLWFDGKRISLYPSIGNWALPCQSHYWIRRNRVVWAPRWSKREIEEARAAEKREKDDYYESRLPTRTAKRRKRDARRRLGARGNITSTAP